MNNFEGVPDLTGKTTEGVEPANETKTTPESEQMSGNGTEGVENAADQNKPKEEGESPEAEEGFLGIDGKNVAKIFLSCLSGDRRSLLREKLANSNLQGVAPFEYLKEQEQQEEFIIQIMDALPEGAEREDVIEKINDLCISREDLGGVFGESVTGDAEERKEGADNKNLEQHLAEIYNKAFEWFRLCKRNNNPESIVAELEEAEKFMKEKQQKLGDNFDGDKHREIELLEMAIVHLREEKERLEKEKKPETARDLPEALREDQKEFSRIVEENTRRLGILEKIKRGENLTEAEKEEYGKMGEITEEELVRRRNSAMNNLAVAAGIDGAHMALEGMRENRENSGKFLEYVRALKGTIKIALSGIGIEKKGMPEQQAQAVNKLEEAEEEAYIDLEEEQEEELEEEIPIEDDQVETPETARAGLEEDNQQKISEEPIAVETKPGRREIESMTLSEIGASSDLKLKTELLSNNSFAISIGAGVNFFGTDGNASLARVEKVLYFKEQNAVGQPITSSLNRGSMESGDYIVIEKRPEKRYYILSVQDGQAPVLKKMEAPDNMVLMPEEKPKGILTGILEEVGVGNVPKNRPTGSV